MKNILKNFLKKNSSDIRRRSVAILNETKAATQNIKNQTHFRFQLHLPPPGGSLMYLQAKWEKIETMHRYRFDRSVTCEVKDIF